MGNQDTEYSGLDPPQKELDPEWIPSVVHPTFVTWCLTKCFLKKTVTHCHRNENPLFSKVCSVMWFYTCNYWLWQTNPAGECIGQKCPWILEWWSHKKLGIISFSTHSSQLGEEFCPWSCLIQPTKWTMRTWVCRACFLLLISCCQPPASYHQPGAHRMQGLTCPRSHSCSETGLGSMPGDSMTKQCFLSPRNLWFCFDIHGQEIWMNT